MSPHEPPPRGWKKQPFDPREWAARNPVRTFYLAWIAVGVILVVVGILSSFYTVEANEEAAILRFGRFHTTT